MSGEIFVSGVGKAYRHWGSEWKRFAKWFGANPKPDSETWVLRGIDFEVARGEAVGIIGQNGAGKSTLLKLVTGTARPTEGEIRLTGRVAAILELGMGFNPELSGRENVRHAAGLLGFSGRTSSGSFRKWRSSRRSDPILMSQCVLIQAVCRSVSPSVLQPRPARTF